MVFDLASHDETAPEVPESCLERVPRGVAHSLSINANRRPNDGKELSRPAAQVTGTLFLTVLLAATAHAETDLYQNTLKGTVWIHNEQIKGFGSGALVDPSNRVVATVEHVVAKTDRVTVYFPAYERGKLIISRERYRKKTSPCRWTTGKVVARDPLRDLALVQLETLPRDARPLRLARDVTSGQTVHVVGNPGVSPLWTYARGWVRCVAPRKLTVSGRPFEARIVEFDSSVYPGNSGGPVVNDSGELVGLVAAGNRNFYFAVHVTEFRSLVEGLRPLAVVGLSNCT